MKAANVARVVDGVADWQASRAKADPVTNETTSLRLRMEAAESLLEVLTDVMLEGTSADPSAPAKSAKKGK